MGRTAGFWEQDSAFPDGQVFLPISYIPAGATLTEISTGNWALSVPASTAVTIPFFLDSLITRYGKQDDAQQHFGLANPVGGFQGAQSQPVPPAAFTTPWGPTGRPPQPSSNFGQPVLSRPKGILIKAVTPVYIAGAGALTAASVGITKTAFVNGVAPLVTQLLAVTALPLAASTFPTVTTVPLPIADQVMLTDRFSQVIIQFALTASAAGAADVYGLFLDVAYNYN
jgi:hypothetical protein